MKTAARLSAYAHPPSPAARWLSWALAGCCCCSRRPILLARTTGWHLQVLRTAPGDGSGVNDLRGLSHLYQNIVQLADNWLLCAAGLKLLKPTMAAQSGVHASACQLLSIAAQPLTSPTVASQLELLQPQPMDPAFMHQTSQPPLPPPQCDAATQVSASTNALPSADAGQQVATAISLQGSPVEQPLLVAPEAQHAGQGSRPCHLSQTKPSAALGGRPTSAGLARTSTGQQAVTRLELSLASALPQQSPSAAAVVAAPQQHSPRPTQSNTINIRLELAAAAQHCCDCRTSEPQAGRKRQQYPTQSPSSPAGVPQLMQSTLPAAAYQLGSQWSHPVQQTLQPSHNRSSDHHTADGTAEQRDWLPIWTVLPLQNQQVVLQSGCCGKVHSNIAPVFAGALWR
jgi:hypothetical protein